MSKVEKKILLYELVLMILSLLIGFSISFLNSYKLTILIGISIFLFKILFGIDKKKHKDTKETIIALTVFIITFFIVYYLFGFLVGFKVQGANVIFSLFPTILYIIGREFLRANILAKVKKNRMLLFLSVLLFIILDLSNSSMMVIDNTDYKPIVLFMILLFPIISNNIVLSYLSQKSGYLPTMFYSGIMSGFRYVFPILPNTNLSATTMIDTIVPILLWVRMSTHYEKKEKKHNTTNDNLINLSILTFPVILMMIILYFTSGYFRYESIVIGTSDMSPTINKGDVVIIDKQIENKIIENDTIAYKNGNVMMIGKVMEINKDDYYIQEEESIPKESIIGKVILRIKYIGWPSLWTLEGENNE
ncbi:MAG: S24/S26 family peptidase [Bacilli bacterium]|nr:S24/S26 family peptidase [Bacilli bacterium]